MIYWTIFVLSLMAVAVVGCVGWVLLCDHLDMRAYIKGRTREIDCYYVDGPIDHERRRYHAEADRATRKRGIKVV